MARSISQTLIRTTSSASTTKTNPYSFLTSKPPTNLSRLQSIRTKFTIPNDNVDIEAMAVKRIEDAIHSIIVRKAVPDWLPFVPGRSYWVPPKRHLDGLSNLINLHVNALTTEQYLSLTNVRGWPSHAFYSSAETLSTRNPSKEADNEELDFGDPEDEVSEDQDKTDKTK